MKADKIKRLTNLEEAAANQKVNNLTPILWPWSKAYPGIPDETVYVSDEFLCVLNKVYGPKTGSTNTTA